MLLLFVGLFFTSMVRPTEFVGRGSVLQAASVAAANVARARLRASGDSTADGGERGFENGSGARCSDYWPALVREGPQVARVDSAKRGTKKERNQRRRDICEARQRTAEDPLRLQRKRCEEEMQIDARLLQPLATCHRRLRSKIR